MQLLINLTIILLVLTGPAISQPSRIRQSADSSAIANKDLQKAAILIELGMLQATELKLQIERANLLNQRLEVMDSVMYEMTRKEMHYEDLIKNHLADISWLEGSLRMSMEGMKGVQREVKREKRKTFLVGVMGVVSAIGLTWLFAK